MKVLAWASVGPAAATALRMRIALIAGYCLITSVAFAHDDYPADCCGDHDCHPVPCDEITVRSDGYFWKGLIFLWSSQRTWPDGRCHVCHLNERHNTGLSDLHHARRHVINSADQQIFRDEGVAGSNPATPTNT